MNSIAYIAPLILLALAVVLALMILSEIQHFKMSTRDLYDALPSLRARLQALSSVPISGNTGSGDRQSGYGATFTPSGRPGVDRALEALRRAQQFSNPLAATVDEFQEQLAIWSEAARTSENEFSKWDRSLSELKEAIVAGSGTGLKKKKAEFQMLADQIMEVLISRNDRDVAPRRKDQNLIRVVDRLAELAEIDFIDPPEGERVIDALHKSVATVPSVGKARKGTVASVRTRGLTQKASGKVIRRADVVEYK
jgi:hypothetical protein